MTGEKSWEEVARDHDESLGKVHDELRTLSEKYKLAERRMDDFERYHNAHKEHIDFLTKKLERMSEDIANQNSDMRAHYTSMHVQYQDLLREIRAGRNAQNELVNIFNSSRIKGVIRWQWTMMVVLTIFGMLIAISAAIGIDIVEILKFKLGL